MKELGKTMSTMEKVFRDIKFLGVESWRDGSKYDGEYVDGNKEGFGEFTWVKDETSFKGYFKNNTISGKGTQKGINAHRNL
jgi:hypothetical protein